MDETRERVEKWLITNGHLINKQSCEREIKITRGTLQKFIKYRKPINDRIIKELFKLIKKMGNV